MQRLSATEAARRFSQVLDAVEARGESFVVVRRGRAVATVAPAVQAPGAHLKDLLLGEPPDAAWAGDLRDLRRSLPAVTDPWID